MAMTVFDGRRIGAISTFGTYKRNNRDLSKKQRVNTGGGRVPPPKRKYGNVKVSIDGVVFDSKREAEVYVQLRSLEKAGAIRKLALQPRYTFPLRGKPLRHLSKYYSDGRVAKGREISYRADFSYEELRGNEWVPVVLDVKGYDTQGSRLKRAMVAGFHGVKVEIV